MQNCLTVKQVYKEFLQGSPTTISGTGIGWLSLLGGWPYLLARAVKRARRSSADWWQLAAGVALWLAAILFAAPLGGGTPSSGICTTASCIVSDAEGSVLTAKGDVEWEPTSAVSSGSS